MTHYYFDIGDVIHNRYEVLERKGGGGFGRVVSVIDRSTGQNIALKYCTSHKPEDLRRFSREVRIMANIQHENVIEIIDNNLEYDPPYFTMPLAEGPVTLKIPDIRGNLEETLNIFEAICNGVIAIHTTGHTHRDINPNNALFFRDGRIVVSDLGLAKLNDRDTTVVTMANIAIATDDYAPPEHYEYGGTRDANHRGDIFMLGRTLYHLYSGQRPRGGLMDPAAVTPGIWYVLQKATRQNQNERYQSVGELLDAIYDVRRITDPALNPALLYASLISSTEQQLGENTYDIETQRKLLQLIFAERNNDEFIKLFNGLPERMLPIYANDFIAEFEPIMRKYFEAIRSEVGGYTFSFAEIVGNKMKIIFIKVLHNEMCLKLPLTYKY